MLNNILKYFFIITIIFFTFLINCFGNPIYSILLFFLLILLNSFFLFSFKKYFLGLTIIIIYAGGIIVLFLFLLITTNTLSYNSFNYKIKFPNNYFLFVLLIFNSIFLYYIYKFNNYIFSFKKLNLIDSFLFNLKYNNDINIFSDTLFSEYFIFLIIIVIILLFALITVVIVNKNFIINNYKNQK